MLVARSQCASMVLCDVRVKMCEYGEVQEIGYVRVTMC